MNQIRENCQDLVSLVAVADGQVVGHMLGHADYYPRFGFTPASQHGITCQWEGVPDEAFMIIVLDAEAMAGVTGEALYRGEFDEAM